MELFFYLLELSLSRTELSLYREVGVSSGVVLVLDGALPAVGGAFAV
jgi:hypothetical protein